MDTHGLEMSLAGKNLYKANLIPQRKKAILDQVKLAAKRMGQTKIDAEVFQITAGDLIDEIESRYDYYSMEEIESVMKLGAVGRLGDNISLSTRTVISWFDFYNKDYRSNLTKKIKPMTENLLAESTESKPIPMTKEELDNYLDFVLDEFESGQRLYSFVYDTFFNNGLTNKFEEDKERYMRLGKSKISEERSNAISMRVRETIKTSDDDVMACGKIEALKDYLQEIIDQKETNN